MKNEKYSALQVAVTYIGLILGPGFVSGQELWQYFGSQGPWWFITFSGALFIMAVVMYIILDTVLRIDGNTVDKVIFKTSSDKRGEIIGYLINILIVLVLSIMVAGIGALGQTVFGWSLQTASIIAIFLALVIAYFGVTGMVETFSKLVPILVTAAIIISIVIIIKKGPENIGFTEVCYSKMIGSPPLAMMNYSLGCLLMLIESFVAMKEKLPSKKSLVSGIVIASFVMLFVGTALLSAISLSKDSLSEELPMLHVASGLGRIIGYIYALMLFFGMFGNVVASVVNCADFIEKKWKLRKNVKIALLAVIGCMAIILSCFGFSNMIKVVYPVIGYMGLISVVFILDHNYSLRRQNRKSRKKKIVKEETEKPEKE